MSDIVQRLRESAAPCGPEEQWDEQCVIALFGEAADEIDRLTRERDEWREAARASVSERERGEWQRERDGFAAEIEMMRGLLRECLDSLLAWTIGECEDGARICECCGGVGDDKHIDHVVNCEHADLLARIRQEVGDD